jgi:hypothetical protein
MAKSNETMWEFQALPRKSIFHLCMNNFELIPISRKEDNQVYFVLGKCPNIGTQHSSSSIRTVPAAVTLAKGRLVVSYCSQNHKQAYNLKKGLFFIKIRRLIAMHMHAPIIFYQSNAKAHLAISILSFLLPSHFVSFSTSSKKATQVTITPTDPHRIPFSLSVLKSKL